MRRTEIQHERRAIKVREASATYSIGKTKLYKLMKDGTLTSVKVGGSRLIPVEALEALLTVVPTD